MRRKTLSVNASTVLLSTILLAKLTVELVNKKKKVEEVYLELACTIGVLLLCLVATVFLIRGKKERKKIERSDSSLSLDSSDKKTEEVKEENIEKPLLKRSVSCPGQLSGDTTPIKEVRDAAKRIENITVKDGKSETNNYYNLTDQQLNVENFGQDKSIIAITLPENYSIKKYENGKEIRSTKDRIIDDGDSYKPVNFNVNKVEKINDKGKKEDSYQFIFKFQNVQKDDVFIEISCSTLNVYSGWKENKEKPVAQYFKYLNTEAEKAEREISTKSTKIKEKELKKLKERAVKVNDDFLIFLDVKEILPFRKILEFFLPKSLLEANAQGLSPVQGESAYKYFKLKLLQEGASYYIHNDSSIKKLNKKFPIKDILVNDQLISKKQEVEQEHQNNVGQDMQVDGYVNQNVTTDKEITNTSQPQNEHSEVLVSPSPSTSSGIASEETFTDDIVTTKSKEKDAQKQPVSRSSSQSSLISQGPVDSTEQPKKKSSFKSKLEKLKSNTKELKQNVSQKLKKTKDKLTKKGEKTSPPSFVNTSSVENLVSVDNPAFESDQSQHC